VVICSKTQEFVVMAQIREICESHNSCENFTVLLVYRLKDLNSKMCQLPLSTRGNIQSFND